MTAKPKTFDFGTLVAAIREVDAHLAAQAGRAVNISLTLRNWLIGLYISEFELNGQDRANYGDNLFRELSNQLRRFKISNTGRRQLYKYMAFFRIYPQIVRTVPAQSRHLLPQTIDEESADSVRTIGHRARETSRCYILQPF